MAEHITDFLVGLGLDTSDYQKGMKRADSEMSSFKSSVLQAGAAMASAFSLKGAIFGFAKQNLELDQMAKLIGVSRDGLYGLEQAAQAFGAASGEATEALKGLENIRAGVLVGDVGALEALAKARINPDSILHAKDAAEAFYNIASQLKGMSQDERLNAANALGISPAVLDLMAQGGQQARALSEQFVKDRRHTEEMADTARDFQAAWVGVQNAIAGALDPLSEALTGDAAAFLNWLKDVTGEGTAFRDVMKTLADNTWLVWGTLGTLTAMPLISFLTKAATAVRALGVALAFVSRANPWLLALGAVVGASGAIADWAAGVGKGNQNDLENGVDNFADDGASAYGDEGGAADVIADAKANLAREKARGSNASGAAFATPAKPLLEVSKAESLTLTREPIVTTLLEAKESREKAKADREKAPAPRYEANKPGLLQINLNLDGEVLERRVVDILQDTFGGIRAAGEVTTAR
jgi:hypothetical protein|nr:MAG TPA: tail tape measure [Caudoviricetes sp.]